MLGEYIFHSAALPREEKVGRTNNQPNGRESRTMQTRHTVRSCGTVLAVVSAEIEWELQTLSFQRVMSVPGVHLEVYVGA